MGEVNECNGDVTSIVKWAASNPASKNSERIYILRSRMVPSVLISYIFLFVVPINSGCGGSLVKTWKTSVSSGTSLKTWV